MVYNDFMQVVEVLKMVKVIKSVSDAERFVRHMGIGSLIAVRDYEVMDNVGCDWAMTELQKVDVSQYTVYSYWGNGSDIRPSRLNSKEAVKWVWKHRAEINAMLKEIYAGDRKRGAVA